MKQRRRKVVTTSATRQGIFNFFRTQGNEVTSYRLKDFQWMTNRDVNSTWNDLKFRSTVNTISKNSGMPVKDIIWKGDEGDVYVSQECIHTFSFWIDPFFEEAFGGIALIQQVDQEHYMPILEDLYVAEGSVALVKYLREEMKSLQRLGLRISPNGEVAFNPPYRKPEDIN